MHQKETLNNQQANTTEFLRRNILESAYKGQKQARIAQEELERQGDQLRTSLNKAKLVAGQTDTTANAVDNLISEAKASKFRKVFRCCLDTCCCCCCCCCRCLKRSSEEAPRRDNATARLQAVSPTPDKEDCESQALVILDSLKSEPKDPEGRAESSWKKTLAPQPGVFRSGTTEIWHRQLDASLTQLQHVAEDMGQSLDEQIRLAQMLTIYLNYGVDQVIGANERLGKAENDFI